jgi:hypothetical protein
VARSMGYMWERDGVGVCGLDGEMVDVSGKRTHDERHQDEENMQRTVRCPSSS